MAGSTALSCPHCGGSFELVRLAQEVDCPYCGHRHALPAELLERMRAYRAIVEQQHARMDEHGRHVAAADRFVQSYASRGGFAGAYLIVLGLPLVLGGAIVGAQQVLPEVGVWFPVGAVALTAALALVVARVGFGTKASDTDTVSVGAVDVCCPECGAAAVIAAGDALGTCRYCRASLLATAVAVGRGIDAAKAAERHGALQRFVKEREVMLHVTRPPRVMAVVVPLLVVAVLAGIVHAAFAQGETEGAGAVVGATVIIAAMAAVLVRQELRERARRHAYRDLAHQLGGRLGYGVADQVTWLNRFWPASYPVQSLYTEGHLIEASTGYPTLVSLKDGRPEALLAADMTSATGNAEAKRHERWLRELGFVVRLNDAGLWLEASPELRKRLSDDVASYRLFAPALAHGARMLAARRARSPVGDPAGEGA